MLFLINIGIICIISYATQNNKSYVPVKTIAAHLVFREEWQMEEAGIEKLKEYECFAMLIDNSGKVVWSYALPEEIPKEYSIKDIASFTKWYLCDYPVFVFIREEGIFVTGAPKESLWKYQMIFRMDTIHAYTKLIIPLFVLNSFLLIFIPVFLIKKQARRREKERTTWIAGVSHDIRTPLSLIMGYAEELKESFLPEDLLEKAEIIENQAIRMRTLIQDLNTENKLEYGFWKQNKEKVHLAAVLRETLCNVMNHETDGRYEFEIEVEKEAEGARIKGEAGLIKRLLENLLNNAIQHNPDGCSIYIGFHKKKFFYVITVADNGKGVTDEQLKGLSTRKKENGLPEHGLGLRLVRQIARLHHWKLKLERKAGGGMECVIKIKR